MFPNSVAGFIIDSPINDMAPIFMQDTSLVKTRAQFLDRNMQLCAADPVCHQDLVNNHLDHLTPRQIVNLALVPNVHWPITVNIPEIGGAAGTYATRHIQRWHLELGMLNWEGSPWQQGPVARALISGALGDRIPLLNMLYGAQGIDPADDTVDVAGTMASDNEYTIYPMVLGLDDPCRTGPNTNVPLSGYQRTMQYLAYGEAVASQAMGTSYSGDAQDAIFNNPSWPVTTLALLNITTPTSGWHGNYPILICGPTIDPFCANTDADDLFTYYYPKGVTQHLLLADGPHVIGGKTWIESPDPGFYCVNSAIDAFVFANATTHPVASVNCTMQYPFQNYLPVTPPYVATAKDAVTYFDYETIGHPAFIWAGTDAISCERAGTVSWTTDDTGEFEIFTLNDCQYFDGFMASGTGSLDWYSPNLYPLGANVAFNLTVTNLRTHVISCFQHTRTPGVGATTTKVTCH
jgi:hypothetical protein